MKFAWEVVKGVAIAIGAIFSFLANQQSGLVKQETEKIRMATEDKNKQSEFDIKAYELVEKTLSYDEKARNLHGIAAAAIVNALTKSPLRDQLQDALRAGVTDTALKSQLDSARQFDLDNASFGVPDVGMSPPKQGATSSSRGNPSWDLLTPAYAGSTIEALRSYRIDIFYCESAAAAITAARKARADEASKKLQQAGAQIAVRVRLLPILVQARPGYKSFMDEIRFDDEGNEKQAAGELASTIGLPSTAIHQIDFKTPNYISVFYCAEYQGK